MSHYDNDGFFGGTPGSPLPAIFPLGVTSRGSGLVSQPGAFTLTADSVEYFRILNPVAPVAQTLPSTNVKSGKTFTMLVSGATEANLVTLLSSTGNTIDVINGNGFITVVALQDTPTASGNWRVVSVEDDIVPLLYVPSGANTNAIASRWIRRGKQVTAQLSQTAATSLGGVSIQTPANKVPVGFRVTQTKFIMMAVLNTGNLVSGICTLPSDGSLYITPVGATFTGSVSLSPDAGSPVQLSYLIS